MTNIFNQSFDDLIKSTGVTVEAPSTPAPQKETYLVSQDIFGPQASPNVSQPTQPVQEQAAAIWGGQPTPAQPQSTIWGGNNFVQEQVQQTVASTPTPPTTDIWGAVASPSPVPTATPEPVQPPVSPAPTPEPVQPVPTQETVVEEEPVKEVKPKAKKTKKSEPIELTDDVVEEVNALVRELVRKAVRKAIVEELQELAGKFNV